MGVDSVMDSNNVYSLIKEGLDASAYRSKVISNNMANINTKNYKRYYVTFEENLQKAQDQDQLQLKTTNERHMQISYGKSGDIQLEQDTSTSMRNDGNNVDIENEKVNQAANELMYDALTGLASMNLSMTRHVITEGKR